MKINELNTRNNLIMNNNDNSLNEASPTNTAIIKYNENNTSRENEEE